MKKTFISFARGQSQKVYATFTKKEQKIIEDFIKYVREEGIHRIWVVHYWQQVKDPEEKTDDKLIDEYNFDGNISRLSMPYARINSNDAIFASKLKGVNYILAPRFVSLPTDSTDIKIKVKVFSDNPNSVLLKWDSEDIIFYDKNNDKCFQGEYIKTLLDLDLIRYALAKDKQSVFIGALKNVFVNCLDLVKGEYRLFDGGEIIQSNDENDFIAKIKHACMATNVYRSYSPFANGIHKDD